MNSIQKELVLVTIAKPITIDGYAFKKGQRYPLTEMLYGGVYVETQFTRFEVIPYDVIGKYTKTWNEVSKNGNVTTITQHEEDVTQTHNWQRDKIIATSDLKSARGIKAGLKARIAELRKTIKFVESGKAEKELNELIELLK